MKNPSHKERNAHDALAFLIVECNVPLPYEVAENLSVKDPLYEALVNAWTYKKERESYQTALLCMVINNSQGGKSKITDFMPKRQMTAAEKEAELIANIQAYNANQKQ